MGEEGVTVRGRTVEVPLLCWRGRGAVSNRERTIPHNRDPVVCRRVSLLLLKHYAPGWLQLIMILSTKHYL